MLTGEIEACLRSMSGKLYHMGFRDRVARTTLADAKECHDWRIYADFAQVLLGIARPLHPGDPIGVDLTHSLYALNATTIDLCLALFPWAKFRKHKGCNGAGGTKCIGQHFQRHVALQLRVLGSIRSEERRVG